MRRLTPCGRIATPTKSIANCARPRNGLGLRPKRKTAPCCGPPRVAFGATYVWSVRTVIKVGSDGRVPIGTQRLRIEKPPATKVILCLHAAGHHSLPAAAPDPKQKPAPSLPIIPNDLSCFENYKKVLL